MSGYASALVGGPHRQARRGLAAIVGTVLLVAASALPVAADEPTQYSEWSDGALVGPDVSLPPPSHDGCPIESPNGKQLYIASSRTGGFGMNDIWRAERPNKRSPWGPMEHLDAPVNTEFNDFCPTPLGDRYLLFVSTRPAENCAGASANGDIYLTRERRNGTWTTPKHLGCFPDGPNFSGGEFGPSLVKLGGKTLLYYSSNGADGVGDQDIYVSRRNRDGSFRAGEPVAGLSTPMVEETMPNVSRDHRELVFASTRLGGEGATDIWGATWDRSTRTWTDLTNFANVNTSAPESRPSLSGDGLRLYFGRGAAPGDVYVSSRVELDDDD
jgi:hypothetical protein